MARVSALVGPVECGEIGIEYDALATQDENHAADLLDRRQDLYNRRKTVSCAVSQSPLDPRVG
jgi:hypothetical protein